MWAMRALAERERRAWCTVDSADVRSLLRDERVMLGHGPTCRNFPNLLRNLVVAWRTIRALRPRVVLCTGSGIVVPFAWVGRLLGARVLYVESGGRVDVPSLSCRIVSRVAHRTYVQWPELAGQVWRGRFRGRLPWEQAAPRPEKAAGGAVITVGTSRTYAFDRLVRASDLLDDGPVTVQRGASEVRPRRARVVDFMSFEELSNEMAAADAVVTHAGIGSVLLALMHGHHPIVMPRQAALGEGVDDHQVHFAHRLAREGLATIVDGPDDVPAAIRASAPPVVALATGANALLTCLADDVSEALA
jgi:UDP-N-acetylglucosamine transferase subunit ALG13